jgi:hypothetical protein
MVMKHSHAAWKCSMAKQHGHTAETNGLHMWRGHAGLHFKYMQKDIYAALTRACRTDKFSREMQQGLSAWKYTAVCTRCTDMQHGEAAWI